MRKYVTLCACGLAVAMLAAGCGTKTEESAETTVESTDETGETSSQVEINGEVELGQYKGIEVEKIDTAVTDEELQQAIDSELQANPDYTEVDRPAQEGDVVNIDYVGMLDGEAFDGGTAQGQDLTLGSGTYIDGFEEGLIGVVKGQELSLELTFPDPYYNNPDLAGKDVVFDVTVNRVEETAAAELNDAFVQRVSDFETVDEWKADLKAQMEEEKTQNADLQIENTVLGMALEGCTFSGIEDSVDQVYNQGKTQMDNMLSMQGMTLEDYLSAVGMTEEDYESYLKENAENNVKMELMLRKIAEVENLEINDEAKQTVAELNGMENFDALAEAAGQEEAERFARNWTAIDFVKSNAVYK